MIRKLAETSKRVRNGIHYCKMCNKKIRYKDSIMCSMCRNIYSIQKRLNPLATETELIELTHQKRLDLKQKLEHYVKLGRFS